MLYADLVIKICIFAYIVDQNRPQPKQLFIKKTELKKPKPPFLQLKPTKIETKLTN